MTIRVATCDIGGTLMAPYPSVAAGLTRSTVTLIAQIGVGIGGADAGPAGTSLNVAGRRYGDDLPDTVCRNDIEIGRVCAECVGDDQDAVVDIARRREVEPVQVDGYIGCGNKYSSRQVFVHDHVGAEVVE